MSSDWLRKATLGVRRPVAQVLGRLRVSPNMLTVAGYLLHLPSMLALAYGHARLGGLLFLLASAFDSLDGSVAREMDWVTVFGAFLDSVTDRFSEATVLLGLFLWYLRTGGFIEPVLIYIAVVGSLMVSYTRARAEGLGLECKTGLLTRFERVLLVGLGLIADQALVVLWTLAVLTVFTALQRVWHVWRQTRELS